MCQTNKSKFKSKFLNEFDKAYWSEPNRHALVKEKVNGIEFYSMYQVKPQLMMKLCDDLDYAILLAETMIQHGVRVFESFDEVYILSKNSDSDSL